MATKTTAAFCASLACAACTPRVAVADASDNSLAASWLLSRVASTPAKPTSRCVALRLDDLRPARPRWVACSLTTASSSPAPLLKCGLSRSEPRRLERSLAADNRARRSHARTFRAQGGGATASSETG
eukprot:6647689-Prymnesium_polylepis.4